MHLWPSATIRDSFKLDYLRKLERNLQRMKSEKESQKSVKQNLLDGQDGGAAKQLDSPRGQVNGKAADLTNPKAHGRDRMVAGLWCFSPAASAVELAQMKSLILSFDDESRNRTSQTIMYSISKVWS